MNVITKTIQLADGRTITIETGKVAKQTDGAVMLKMNNTVLLATALAVSLVDSPSAKAKPQTMKSSHHAWWTVCFVHCSQLTITQKYS